MAILDPGSSCIICFLVHRHRNSELMNRHMNTQLHICNIGERTVPHCLRISYHDEFKSLWNYVLEWVFSLPVLSLGDLVTAIKKVPNWQIHKLRTHLYARESGFLLAPQINSTFVTMELLIEVQKLHPEEGCQRVKQMQNPESHKVDNKLSNEFRVKWRVQTRAGSTTESMESWYKQKNIGKEMNKYGWREERNEWWMEVRRQG